MNRILFSLLYARGRRLLLRRLVLKNQCLLLKQQVCYLIDQTSKLKNNSANLMLSNIHFNIVILLRSLFFLWLLLVYCFFFLFAFFFGILPPLIFRLFFANRRFTQPDNNGGSLGQEDAGFYLCYSKPSVDTSLQNK